MKKFMIDIETTGIGSKENDILQIGIVELNFNGDIWIPGRDFNHILRSVRRPTTPFAKKHMVALYNKCNEAPESNPELIRQKMLSFFNECGAKSPEVFLMGWNATNFDIPFLFDKKMLEPSYYVTIGDKEEMVGDVHYRVYEIAGALALAIDVTGKDSKILIKEALERCPEIALPDAKEHDALFDCYKQTKFLNGIIRLLRK